MGSIPGWGTKIPCAMGQGSKIKNNKKKKTNHPKLMGLRVLSGVGGGKGGEVERQMDKERQQIY